MEQQNQNSDNQVNNGRSEINSFIDGVHLDTSPRAAGK